MLYECARTRAAILYEAYIFIMRDCSILILNLRIVLNFVVCNFRWILAPCCRLAVRIPPPPILAMPKTFETTSSHLFLKRERMSTGMLIQSQKTRREFGVRAGNRHRRGLVPLALLAAYWHALLLLLLHTVPTHCAAYSCNERPIRAAGALHHAR